MSRRFTDLLPSRPLIGVVHLPPSLGLAGCPGLSAACEALERDLRTLGVAGFAGILLENENDKPHTIAVTKVQVAWLTRLCAHARTTSALPLGINVQRLDWRAALSVAAVTDLDFVRLDTWVDRVRMQGEIVQLAPAEVLALRRHLGADRVLVLTDVHVKHAELVEPHRPLAASAADAVASGADAVIVTGPRTGQPPRRDDLVTVRDVLAGSAPVLVGSGLTADLAASLAPAADGALCGTALKDGDRIDLDRAKEVVTAWRLASRQ